MLQGLAAAAGKPTRITYVTGNHGRVLNNFDVLRQRIAAALPGVPVHFSTELLAPEYGVLARHGQQWDDNCHGWKLYTDVLKKGHVGRFAPEAHRVMAIGEPLTAELMAGLVSGAQQEFQDGLPPEIQYIVYGHTHTARHDCFSAEPGGAVRMYINAGTYLPLIARALDEQSFSRSHRMTLAFFYKDAEDQEGRQGHVPTLDFWDGVRRKTYTV